MALTGSGNLRSPERLAPWDIRLARFPYATAVALFGLAFAVYAGALRSGFVYDDESQVLMNPFVANPHLWRRIFAGSVWSFQGPGVQTNFYRPLQFLCYSVLYRLAGPSPAIFHVFSLFIYALTIWVVYRLGARLLGSDAVALAGALLWALHPLHVEAVAWISALPDLGCGLFFLLAFLLFQRAEQAEEKRLRGHVLAALAYFPALLFKETALSLPLVLLAWWFFCPSPPRAVPAWRRAQIWVLYVVPVATYLVARRYALGHLSYTAHLWRITPRDAAASLGLLGEHLHLFLWPAHLSAFRTFELGASLRSPWPWLAVAVLLLALGARRRQPLLGFLAWWWFLTLLPCLDARQLSTPLLADRFSYLPSVGLCMALAELALVRLPASAAGARFARPALAGLGVIMFLWAAATVRTVPNWQDEETLLGSSLRQSPGAAALHSGRAVMLEYRHGDYEGAEHEYELALQLNRASFRPILEVDYECLLGLGRIAQHRRDVQGAMAYDERAARLRPQLSPAYDALGVLDFPSGNYARAALHFEQAIKVNPQDLGARFYLGTCYLKLGSYREAADQFHAATIVDPTFRPAYEAEARALVAAGDLPGAAKIRSLEPKK